MSLQISGFFNRTISVEAFQRCTDASVSKEEAVHLGFWDRIADWFDGDKKKKALECLCAVFKSPFPLEVKKNFDALTHMVGDGMRNRFSQESSGGRVKFYIDVGDEVRGLRDLEWVEPETCSELLELDRELATFFNNKVIPCPKDAFLGQAKVDWPRFEMVFGGEVMSKDDEFKTMKGILGSVLGNGPSLEAVVPYLTQNALAPMVEVMREAGAQVESFDGHQFYEVFGGERIGTLSVVSQEGGARIDYLFRSKNLEAFLSKAGECVSVDPAQSHFTYAYSVYINAKGALELISPFYYDVKLTPGRNE